MFWHAHSLVHSLVWCSAKAMALRLVMKAHLFSHSHFLAGASLRNQSICLLGATHALFIRSHQEAA